ncbi:MAG TPA: tetratricopeptide repeat protein [Polyangiales bacterium]
MIAYLTVNDNSTTGGPDALTPFRTLRLDGDRLRKLRVQGGLTRERMSDLSRGPEAVSVATIKRAERGLSIYPGSAAAIAQLLGTPLDRLLVTPSEPNDRSPSRGRAAIAVLPFAVHVPEQRVKIFVDGLVEDLTHRLAHVWFPVIARCSSFSFRDQVFDTREIGRHLNADYLVEGSVRTEDPRVHVRVQLVDAHSGHQLWCRSYEEAWSELRTLQARLAADIVSELTGRVIEHEVQRSSGREQSRMDAWELSLRALWHLHRSTAQDGREARDFALAALQRDPCSALPRYVLLLSHQHELINQWTQHPSATRSEMRAIARDFEQVCPGNPWMYVATAYASVAHGEREDAISRLEEALDLAPNAFVAHSLYGQVLAMGGHPDQGIHELELARKLSPRDPQLWTVLLTTALAHFAAERYSDAVEWAELAVRSRPHIAFCHAALAAARARLGDLGAAKRALQQALERHPDMHLEGFGPSFAATEPEIVARFADGLARAGLSARPR